MRRAGALPRSQVLDSGSEAAQAPVSRNAVFEAAVLTRLARRGHAPLIAQTVWEAICNPGAGHLSNSECTRGAEPGSNKSGPPTPRRDNARSEAIRKATSERRASHAQATSLSGSRSAASTAQREFPDSEGKASALSQMPSAHHGARSGTEAMEGPVAEPDQGQREAVSTTRQLLCQVADSQALGKILAALLLEAPAGDPQIVVQVHSLLLRSSPWPS